MARRIDFSCASCGKPVSREDKIGQNDSCDGCGAPLHACVQCRWHDPLVPKQCRQDEAEGERNPAAANHCEWFEPDLKGVRDQQGERAKDARQKLDDLFS